MSDFLRGLLGVAQGAGQGYFRGQAMKAEQAEAEERLAMARERERIAQEDQRFQREDRERQARERDVAESNRLRQGIGGVLRGAAIADLVRQSLQPGEGALAARDRLAQIAPERLTGVRQELKDREPPAPVKKPWERDGFADEDSWLGAERRRAQATWRPRVGEGEGGEGDAAPKPRTLNTIQDAASDYVARFAAITDPAERAKQAYQAFLMAGQRPQAGENPDQIWTAFVAASRRMAGGAAGGASGASAELMRALRGTP